MKLKYSKGVSFLTGILTAVSICSYPVRAEENDAVIDASDEITTEDTASTESTENNAAAFEDNAVYHEDNEENSAEEDWLSVATEVMTYYAEKSSGLEPLATENDIIFYDVIADGSIDLTDATYFLSIYATIGSGMEFEGYIPKRDGTISPVVPITTDTTETTTTTAEITTTTIETISSAMSSETTAGKTTTTSSKTTGETAASTLTTTTVKTTAASSKTKTDKTTTSTTSTTKTETTTAQTTVSQSNDTTEVVTRTPLYYGVDVSVYQKEVDWQQVKDSGVDFAIIRAGYGKHVNQEDRYFDINMQNAKEAGIDCGAYWFSYALTPEDAEKEADAFYEVIKDYQFEFPIFFDYETMDQYNLDPEENSAIIHAFCDKMESYGYYVSLCSFVGFLNYRVEDEVLETFDTWIAHYDVKVPWYSKSYGIWQYSCTGEVPGIDYDVDLNYAYYDYPAIMTENHLNGF